jgi:hypothetical protein
LFPRKPVEEVEISIKIALLKNYKQAFWPVPQKLICLWNRPESLLFKIVKPAA